MLILFEGGQSEFPKGLLYGGVERERGTLLVIDALKNQGLHKGNLNLKNVIRMYFLMLVHCELFRARQPNLFMHE